MDLEVSKSKILEIKSLIKNIIASRESFINEYKNSLFSYLNEMEGKIQLIKYEIDKNNTRIELLNIVAPVDGKVQQISVNTIGAIIPSSTVIMQIVPIQNSFSIEALLTNKDISQLSNNNPAIFKVDAFPYSKFGTIDCKIQNISNDSIDLKDSKEKFYKINLEIINNLEQLSEKGIYLKAGMTGSTSFKVGERKIIEYLLSPLTEYKNEVMREP